MQATTPDWTNIGAVPLTPRGTPVIVWTGREVLVVGGRDSRSEPSLPLRDGAAYDAGTGKWRRIADLPTDPPLFNPAAVWTGDHLLLVGSSCRNLASQETPEFDECAPGPREAVRYDPRADRWSRLKLPDALDVLDPAYVSAVGGARGRAIFKVPESRAGRGQSYWSVADDEWTKLPDPPIAPDAQCIAAGRLVVVAYEDLASASEFTPGQNFSGPPPPDPQSAHRRASSIDLDGGRWTVPSSPEGPDPVSIVLNVVCAGDEVMTLPSRRSEGAIGRYQPGEQSWGESTSPPQDIGARPLAVWSAGKLFVFDGRSLVYDQANNTWVGAPAPEGQLYAAVDVGDRVLLQSVDPQTRKLWLRTYPT